MFKLIIFLNSKEGAGLATLCTLMAAIIRIIDRDVVWLCIDIVLLLSWFYKFLTAEYSLFE